MTPEVVEFHNLTIDEAARGTSGSLTIAES